MFAIFQQHYCIIIIIISIIADFSKIQLRILQNEMRLKMHIQGSTQKILFLIMKI